MKRGIYWTCPICGCNLDPGEVCDCETERREKEEKLRLSAPKTKKERGGQLKWAELAS